MRTSLKPISQQVIVITGASSGIGRATAETAVRGLGGFDTWVNNAGVSIYGRIGDVPVDDARRLFETNYWAWCTAASRPCRCRATTPPASTR